MFENGNQTNNNGACIQKDCKEVYMLQWENDWNNKKLPQIIEFWKILKNLKEMIEIKCKIKI